MITVHHLENSRSLRMTTKPSIHSAKRLSSRTMAKRWPKPALFSNISWTNTQTAPCVLLSALRAAQPIIIGCTPPKAV